MLSLPFALVGGVWLMWWLGFIAIAGVAAETGVVMLIYLDQALEHLKAERAAQGRPFTRADLYEAIMVGAVERVRPKGLSRLQLADGIASA